MINPEILNAPDPLREAAKQFIADHGIKEWNQKVHQRFLLALIFGFAGLSAEKPEAKKLAGMLLGSNGLAGNCSQFRQACEKPADKSPLGGLLAPNAKPEEMSAEEILAQFS